MTRETLKLRLQYDNLLLGPGKAELMRHIRDTGSIAAAGRLMGMSYKRAWLLVEELNAAFPSPIILSARGGAGGGRAELSPLGCQLLTHYQSIVAITEREAAHELAAIRALLQPATAPKAPEEIAAAPPPETDR